MLGLQRANIPGYLMVKLFSKNSNLCDHNSPTSQTDRQTTCDRNTALCTKVHRAVKMTSGGLYCSIVLLCCLCLNCMTPRLFLTVNNHHIATVIKQE